ncbi:hypothetical protein [Tumebacillus permanentifrigoris]|uniref:Uncharacterized protein n=1 Tax=Tumebacillus permanentifrigoris TaxID=378543 RepID=A0A316DAM3_9BACL|nr:hypothetical protein [Tumebacillus permanentifrigoris]PWK13730.1 hypothetical protein C7459_1068 [Tumebacillus permanentifrigoris]
MKIIEKILGMTEETCKICFGTEAVIRYKEFTLEYDKGKHQAGNRGCLPFALYGGEGCLLNLRVLHKGVLPCNAVISDRESFHPFEMELLAREIK